MSKTESRCDERRLFKHLTVDDSQEVTKKVHIVENRNQKIYNIQVERVEPLRSSLLKSKLYVENNYIVFRGLHNGGHFGKWLLYIYIYSILL